MTRVSARLMSKAGLQRVDDERHTTEACDLAEYAGLSPISRAGCGTEASGGRVKGWRKGGSVDSRKIRLDACTHMRPESSER